MYQLGLFDAPAPIKAAWGTPIEIERRRRIRVSVWAHAYEALDVSLVDDHTFDAECMLVDPKVSTGHAILDAFFRKHFVAYSGQWVTKHPDKRRLDALTRSIIKRRGL